MDPGDRGRPPDNGGVSRQRKQGLDLEERVLEVLARWDRRLERAVAAWAELDETEQRSREAELDAAGETEEWVVVLWSWWTRAAVADQEQLQADVTVLRRALWAAAADGRLDAPTEEAASARHLLSALERMAEVLGVDQTD
jgi:hypothetical protein